MTLAQTRQWIKDNNPLLNQLSDEDDALVRKVLAKKGKKPLGKRKLQKTVGVVEETINYGEWLQVHVNPSFDSNLLNEYSRSELKSLVSFDHTVY